MDGIDHLAFGFIVRVGKVTGRTDAAHERKRKDLPFLYRYVQAKLFRIILIRKPGHSTVIQQESRNRRNLLRPTFRNSLGLHQVQAGAIGIQFTVIHRSFSVITGNLHSAPHFYADI